MKRFGLLILSLLLSSLAYAGDELCNGGVSLQCGDTYRMLDLVEAGPLYNLHFSYPITMNRYDILRQVLQRPEIRNSQFGLMMAMYLPFFEKEARFVTDVELQPTNDEGPFLLPKDCQGKKQAAVQIREAMPFNGWKYMVSQDVWNHMSELDRAGLMLHEFFLRYLMAWTPWNKSLIPIRYMTALALSDELGSPSFQPRPRSFDDLLPQLPYKDLL